MPPRIFDRPGNTPALTPSSTVARGRQAPEMATCSPTANEMEPRDRIGRTFGRLFGLVWLFFVLNIVEFFRSQDFSLLGGAVAWTALALFVAADVILILFANPLWASRSRRDVSVNRFLIGLMVAINVGFVLAFRQENFGYLFIYPAVNSGLYLARHESFRVVAGLTGLTLLAGLFAESSSTDVFTSVLLVGGIGMNTVFFSALMTQNRELRRARAEITRLAVAEERLRFARDLHDLLGHSLSLIALKSELAGRLLSAHPERARTEIADVESVARTALQEVRDAVTGYRTPSLTEELSNARQMLTAAGVSVRVQSSATNLPTEIDRVLAWFVREGSTNIIRHAGAMAVTIDITHTKTDVFAEITDNGRAASSDSHSPSNTTPGEARNGVGLTGLGERIRACDGTLSSGPMPGGGFRLYARIPVPVGSEPTSEPAHAVAHFPTVERARERVAP